MPQKAASSLVKQNRRHAKKAGLRYVNDTQPGFSRRKRGKAFIYFDQRGKAIENEKVIRRINSLAIPPAYRDVWICPYANGHIQATGLNARGRKQYRYHAKWREVRDSSKFEYILRFGEKLSCIRRQVARDLKRKGLPKEKVLATVIKLLDVTLIRVGNAEYARENQSYGLTTLRKKHVEVRGAEVRFQFTGKSGKHWNLQLNDKRIAKVIRQCSDLPGYELFKYKDENGQVKDVTSTDINHYLQHISGDDFTAKDYRTWSGTVLAAIALQEYKHYDSKAQAKRNITQAIEYVAKQLGNTPAICRKCYIHPEVLNAYLDKSLVQMVKSEIRKTVKKAYSQLSSEELLVFAFLRKAA